MSAALKALRDALLAEYVHPAAVEADALAEMVAVAEKVRAAAPEPLTFPPTGHPVIRHLESVLVAAQDHAPHLAAALRPLAEILPWRYGYAPRPDAPGLEHRMAWAELVGPAAPFHSDHVGLGLTLIGPHTYYPPHRHPAVEIYRVVAGIAEWSAAGRSAVRPPDSLILHPSNVVHAMRTADQPLLAVYSWSGDVVSPSVWEGT